MGDSGKPRACQNCKSRKLKCDYRRPACLRCEKAQITCKGYLRETVFVNKNSGNVSSKEPLVPKNSNPGSATLSFAECLQELSLQLQKPRDSPLQLRIQCLSLLKKLYLPQLNAANIEQSPIFTWLPIVCYLQGISHALDHSLYAFCVIQVAITKSATISVDDALQIYYDSLRTLQVELDDKKAAQKDEILAAISVLSTCELFVCPTDHAWQAHAHGIAEILRIRGDLDFSTPLRRTFYFRIRMILLFEALSKPLSRPMASSHSSKFMSMASNGDPMSDLIDVAWEVPAVLEKSDIIMADNNTIPELIRRDAFKPSLDVIEKLHNYQQRYKDKLEILPYWAKPSTAYNPADESYDTKLFPFALHFASIEIATHLILYWAILLQVHYSILCLHLQFFGHTIVSPESDLSDFGNPTKYLLNSRSVTLNSIKEEADKLARYLCQSIEYCHRIEHGTIGPQLTCYAQWVLKTYFRKFSYKRELVWCLNIKGMRGPSFHSGIELMCFQD